VDELHETQQLLAEARVKIDSQAKTVRDLESDLNNARQEKQRLEERLKDQMNSRVLRLELDHANASTASLQAETTLLKQTLKESQENIRRLEKERDELRETLQTAQTQQNGSHASATPKATVSEGWGTIFNG
jgi:chromosome segregation ATPase